MHYVDNSEKKQRNLVRCPSRLKHTDMQFPLPGIGRGTIELGSQHLL